MDDVLAINQPSTRVALFLTDQKRQYFIVTENKVLCEVPSLQDALLHICILSSYPKECELLFFLYVFQHPNYVGRTSLYLNVNVLLVMLFHYLIIIFHIVLYFHEV